ncbi:hypothetical protein DCAR_0416986 [Daucus carota subsp. sativus]|uniref:LSM domain-containing protein n=1 Tax=Daucus carota subsp. sativus TaxID=79200 RepID=A0AAF0X0X0_DAUCS|nr:hypothetical protein DCAR_0416986 [Daucus carota subsp. sativus]
MSRSGQPPYLKKYMDKKLQIKMNANRNVNGDERNDNGMVVIRENSVVTVEALEPVSRG